MEMPPRVGSLGSMFGSFSRPCRRALSAVRRKEATESPGMAVGYWNARNIPRRARLSGDRVRMFMSFQITSPCVTTYAGWPIRA